MIEYDPKAFVALVRITNLEQALKHYDGKFSALAHRLDVASKQQYRSRPSAFLSAADLVLEYLNVFKELYELPLYYYWGVHSGRAWLRYSFNGQTETIDHAWLRSIF